MWFFTMPPPPRPPSQDGRVKVGISGPGEPVWRALISSGGVKGPYIWRRDRLKCPLTLSTVPDKRPGIRKPRSLIRDGCWRAVDKPHSAGCKMSRTPCNSAWNWFRKPGLMDHRRLGVRTWYVSSMIHYLGLGKCLLFAVTALWSKRWCKGVEKGMSLCACVCVCVCIVCQFSCVSNTTAKPVEMTAHSSFWKCNK